MVLGLLSSILRAETLRLDEWEKIRAFTFLELVEVLPWTAS